MQLSSYSRSFHILMVQVEETEVPGGNQWYVIRAENLF
jgi:hypothetical protein